ncbi:P-loop NTPase family protein [Candidatus Synechococcus calcipolaris G9]|uniref:P-loop NTPase family protein n=1 Tax=Candidatus Synechococcus calcipolaris G9 TaxID=1497997 RepID=A0ABT6F121_9SYNE|nr:P-loop NTPase family protein [Candidatus Synechococcus calcipolaris]MDG2991548.1 P-loop NTPase family protein [Candidatus Synechococcus calcipolaris G9]
MVSQLPLSQPTPTSFPYAVEGLVQVFTSVHRSFFTGVMAQALTLAGQGTPVLVVQFLKGGINMGPDQPVRLGQNLDWLRCNLSRCLDAADDITPEERQATQELWQYTCDVIKQEHYRFFVLDELSLAIQLGLIPEEEVVGLLEQRPRSLDIILTGPDMPGSILNLADQVTQLRRNSLA